MLGALLALLAAGGTSWAAFPGANGLIAYSERQDYPDSEIFTVAPAGGDPTQLTDNAIPEGYPSWSADGRRLTFIRGSAYLGQHQNVWTMHADGTRQRQVTHGATAVSSPSFSPGGGRIVMARGWDIRGNIVIVHTDGSDPMRLTSDWEAEDPAFSPNGRRIVFSGAPREERPRGIWVMRRNGTHKRLLAAEGYPDYMNPDFDPDGSHIVFERCIDDVHECDTDDILMRSNGRHKRVIKGAGGNDPVFSPNGTRIALIWRYNCWFDLYCLAGSKVVTVARHGGGARAVTQPDATGEDYFFLDSSPSWQPIPQP